MAVTREYKEGEVQEIYDADTGAVRENGRGEDDDFEQRGAQVEFVQGDKVTFLVITTPKGKRIIKNIGKK